MNDPTIKLSRIGTVTETISTTKMARDAGWQSIISRHAGETGCIHSRLFRRARQRQIKTVSLSRSDQVAKIQPFACD